MRLRALGLLLLVGCNSKPEGTLQLVTGGETDTFTREPRPVVLVVERVDASGAATELARSGLPADAIDLGDQDGTVVTRIRVTGRDAAGITRVSGTSLPVQLAALDGATLRIFVQRTGELARLPGSADAREAPLVASLLGRYLVTAGGPDAARAAQSSLYDLATLDSLPSPPKLPRAPRSMVAAEARLLLIDDEGATWFDTTTSTASGATAPAGGTFAEVAGGDAIPLADGSTVVVGATRRSEPPTARVLRVSPTGALSFATLAAPRLGAAVARVAGRGLVIAGGSATGAGVEVLADSGAAAIALSYAPDPTAGGGAAPLDADRIAVVGGVAGSGEAAGLRVIDLRCTSACTPAVVGPTSPALVRARGAGMEGAPLIVGEDAGGASHVLRVTAAEATEVPLRAPRRGARAAVSALGAVAIVGGGATMLEAFAP